MMEKGRMLRGFMVFCGSLEIMLFGGVIFGWASLVYVYKDQGYFSHLCPAENRSLLHNLTTPAMSKPGDYSVLTHGLELNGSFSDNLTEDGGSNLNPGGDLGPSSCKEQDNQFNLIFTIATVFTGIMCFVNGLIYDKLGTRFCRTVAIVCFLVAMACLYFASPELPELLYPGATLLVYGGYLILITNLQLANLVPTYRSTIMSLYAGSYDCSAAMLLVFKAAHEAGVSVNTCFLVQACAFTVLVCTSTFCTLPKYHLPWPLPEDFHINPPIQRLCRRAGDVVHNQEVEVEPAAGEDWEPEQKRLNVETDSNNPKRSHLSIPGINIDTASVSTSSRPGSVKTARAFNNSRFLAADISTSECLLAINHVPRLSTSSINRSIQKHSGRTPNLARAVLMRRSAERSAGLGAGQHHLSLLNIPGGQRSLLHRGSVSMDNVTLALPRPSAQEGSLAINHVPQLSTASLSVPHSSPANSVFRSMNSVGGISEIRPAPDGSFLDAPMGDDSPWEKPTSFRKEVLSPLFLVEVMWMSFQRLRSWFFVGVFNPWITALADGHRPTISYYTSVFAAMQFFGIFTAPLNGRLMDRKPGEKYNYKSVKFERLHAAIPSFALNSTVVLLLSIGAAIPVIEVQYVTFALHVLNRSFTYGPNSAFIANAFPFQYFGILLGTSLTLSAIFGMLQYPLFVLIQGPLNNDPKMVNIALIVLMTLTYVHPIYIWIYLQRKLKKRAKLAAGECTEPLNKEKGDNSGVNDKATTNNGVNDTAISSTEMNKDSGIDDSGDTNNLAGANDDESPKMSAAETMENKAGGLDVPSINPRDNISQCSQENTYL